MNALHARRRRGPRDLALLLGLAGLLAVPSGCGGQPESTGAPAASPKAAERKRDMENYMKTQQGK